jgi:hypothetical protein
MCSGWELSGLEQEGLLPLEQGWQWNLRGWWVARLR